MKNYNESPIQSMVFNIMDGRNYIWSDKCTEMTIKSIFVGFASYLGKHKSKDKPVALILKDVYDKFHFAAYVQFLKQEEENADEGSWALNFTFEEEDIDKRNWEIHNFPEDEVAFAEVNKACFIQLGVGYNYIPKNDKTNSNDASPQELFCTVMDVIKEYMEQTLSGGDPSLEMDNYFTMTAEPNGEKIYIGIEPSPILKQYVKDDSEIEVNKTTLDYME